MTPYATAGVIFKKLKVSPKNKRNESYFKTFDACTSTCVNELTLQYTVSMVTGRHFMWS